LFLKGLEDERGTVSGRMAAHRAGALWAGSSVVEHALGKRAVSWDGEQAGALLGGGPRGKARLHHHVTGAPANTHAAPAVRGPAREHSGAIDSRVIGRNRWKSWRDSGVWLGS
jgi:hypothetical protein